MTEIDAEEKIPFAKCSYGKVWVVVLLHMR